MIEPVVAPVETSKIEHAPPLVEHQSPVVELVETTSEQHETDMGDTEK